MGAKHWTEEDDRILKEVWESGGTIESKMHLLHGRNLNAVYKRASKLKLRYRYRNLWTKDEDEILREIWREHGALKLYVDRLPRHTYKSCIARASELELGSRRPALYINRFSWVKDAVLRELDRTPGLHCRQLALVIGANPEYIRKLMAKLHRNGIRISGWTHMTVSASAWSPLWSIGDGPDMPAPEKPTEAERVRAYRARKAIKNGAVNPFLVATGIAAAPASSMTGRVIKHLHDDELEAA